jgi:hypothetical protein
MPDVPNKHSPASPDHNVSFEPLLDSGEAAALLKIHTKTCSAWREQEKFMAFTLGNSGDSEHLISIDGSTPNTSRFLAGALDLESYVDAQCVANHLSITRREVLKLTRARKLPAHAIDPSATRKIYRYRLSEIDAVISQHLLTQQTLGSSACPRDNSLRQPRGRRG